mgnify:CR=1 FL=1
MASSHSSSFTRGAALSTSCTAKISPGRPYYDLRQNGVLGRSTLPGGFESALLTTKFTYGFAGRCFADIVGGRYGLQTTKAGVAASTDFVSVLRNWILKV